MSTEWRVVVAASPPVVIDKDDQCVFGEPFTFELIKDAANSSIESDCHGPVGFIAAAAADLFQIGLRGMVGSMGSIKSKVHEKRFGAAIGDELGGGTAKFVGHVVK